MATPVIFDVDTHVDDIGGGVEGVEEDVGVEDESQVEERPGKTTKVFNLKFPKS
jgi:hypothetical protein